VHVEEHPSCELVLLSSQFSLPLTSPSPQTVLQDPLASTGKFHPSQEQF
jgi:hypothetical protein